MTPYFLFNPLFTRYMSGPFSEIEIENIEKSTIIKENPISMSVAVSEGHSR